MAVTPERMTLAEFLKLPEVKPARELRNGVVSQKMPPSGPHSSIQGWFVSRVNWFGVPRDLARALPEARIILGQQTYVPDAVVYLWERIPEDDHGNLPLYFSSPPDLAVEILSPGQSAQAHLDRCRELVAHGVRVVLFANPARRTVHLVRDSGVVGPLELNDAIDVTDVLPAFELTVAELFEQMSARPPRRQV